MAQAAAIPVEPEHRRGILKTRPDDVGAAGEPLAPGTRSIGLGGERAGLIHVPSRGEGDPAPLLVMLHGAGAAAGDVWPMVADAAERHGAAVLVPDARGTTWDMIRRGFGPDVAFLDRALWMILAGCAIDPKRIAIGGFSDGASYAVTLGLTNGRLFSDILAFSPGFAAPPRTADAPRVFLSHGREDPVLPIERCGRPLAATLREAGYDVDYREFSGGHVVPVDMVNAAFERFAAG